MKLYLQNHTFRYAMEQLQMSLFPAEKLEYTEVPLSGGDGACAALHHGAMYDTAVVTICRNGITTRAQKRILHTQANDRSLRQLLQQTYYQAALQQLPSPPPWGAFSGVRPTKIATRHLLSGGTAQSCDQMLRDDYYIREDRRQLCLECAEQTVAATKLLRPGDISLYVGIPFCPTRCSYCSFVSQSVQSFGNLVAPYLDALEREIRETGIKMQQTPLHIRTLYVGGGTPTTLSSTQLDRLLGAIEDSFDLSDCLEITVEAGRPETLNFEKLQVMRRYGVQRISINPQTMNDTVLRTIGRNHTAKQILNACAMAHDAGFDHVNMDLIAGLPGDTAASFAQSLEQVIALQPAAVTIHTLALKKAADLYAHRELLPSDQTVAEMLCQGEAALRAAQYVPYYLYRQKYMSGSFENVGWCRSGYQCLYNIYMMEELHSILALGAGGVTKINLPGGRLRRLVNPKYPLEYQKAIDRICEEKAAFFAADPNA